MPAVLRNFPASAVVDVLLSYLQWAFSNDEITPDDYRWNENDRESRIRISGPFVIDNEKAMSAPFVVVERGSFAFANMTLDNIKAGGANTLNNTERVDWMDGIVNVICGSGVAGEASSLANFLGMMFQADRKGIINNSGFIRNLNYVDISPEMPVVKDTEVRRWEVTLRLRVSMQIGWFIREREPVLWNSAEIYSLEDPPEVFSDKGETTQGVSILTDNTKNFGFGSLNNPRLIEKEFNGGQYYIRFKDNTYKQLYTIIGITSNTLTLQTHDENDDPTPWLAPETATGVEYDLLWNKLHIHMKLPNK
jgi:hypothetical protein